MSDPSLINFYAIGGSCFLFIVSSSGSKVVPVGEQNGNRPFAQVDLSTTSPQFFFSSNAGKAKLCGTFLIQIMVGIRRLFKNRLSLKMFIEIWSTETTDLLGSKAGALKLELKDYIFKFLS